MRQEARPGRILVVDDERSARLSLAEILRMEGYEVMAVDGGAAAIQFLKAQDFDMVLCDLKMPDVGGLAVLAACQEFRPATEFVLLTAYGTLDTAVEALRQGASDYLLKPALPETILTSVKQALDKRKQALERQSVVGALADALAVLQQVERPARATEEDHILRGRGVTLNLDRRTAMLDGAPLSLTPTEFEMLSCLMAAEGRPVSAEELVYRVQGYRCEPEEASGIVRVHVSRLRQKMERDPADPQLIVTVRGAGYAFAINPAGGGYG